MNPLAFVMLCLCTVWIVLGFASVVWATRSSRRHPPKLLPVVAMEGLPGVTVLKPLCGADAGLAANLESFFVQDHRRLELVFGVERSDDPAIAVVERLQRRYPHVRSRLVVHSGGRAINPKVRNLIGIVPYAQHDLLLISDSNVCAPRHYVREMVETMVRDEGTGLVTNLFAGVGEDSLGAALESVQLNGFCAAGPTLCASFGDAAVIGKSMLFSRRVFEELGGFGRVANVLAEDFVMGKMFQHGGHAVRIAPTVLRTVTRRISLAAYLGRHQRWAMLRWRIRPFSSVFEPLTSPVAHLPLAWWALGPWALGWVAALLVVRDVGGWLVLRGPSRAWLPLLLAPLRDLSMLAVWLHALFTRHVTWRGHRVRVGAGTFLFQHAS